MDISKLMKPYPIRITYDQHIAIEKLKMSSYNKTKFIRLAIKEKLKRDFRSLLKEMNTVKLPF